MIRIPHRYFLPALLVLAFCFRFNAQTAHADRKGFLKGGDVFGTRNFIENKGQFSNPLGKKDEVLFVYDHQGEKIFLTTSGLIYELGKIHYKSAKEIQNEEEEGEEEEYEQGKEKIERHFVEMRWLNPSGEIIVEAKEKQEHYITFGTKQYDSWPYKKIVYHNIYKGIDIEYLIPEKKKTGIKYNVIVRDGARLQDLKMQYSGAVRKMRLYKDGDLHITTPLDDIIEHTPVAFDSNGAPVEVLYNFDNNIVGFTIPDAQKEKELLIDPWLTTVTTLTTLNNVYDVDYDFGGNTFIYGGAKNGGPGRCQVAKYSPFGALLWTFSGSVVTPTWSSGSIWSSNFKVARAFSKTYIGSNFSTANVLRIDGNGNYDNLITNGTPSVTESWHTEFDCAGDLLIFGGANTSFERASSVTGSISNVSIFNSTVVNCCQDVCSEVYDANGNLFVYFLGHAQLQYKLAQINSTTYTNTIWIAPTTNSLLTYLANKSQYVGTGSNGSAVAFNALAVNSTYLYFYDGQNVGVYSKANGSAIGATTVPSAGPKTQGGIAVDDCNNVYVGANGSIQCFYFNGLNFVGRPAITFTANTPNQNIYDLQYDYISKQLFYGGSDFVGSTSAVYSQTCNPFGPQSPCTFGQFVATVASQSITCANLGSATITPVGGVGPFTFYWYPPINQSSSVATNIAPGTYTYLVTDFGGGFQYSTTTTFSPLVPLTGTLDASASVPCYVSMTASAGVISLAGGSGNQSYTWTNGISTYTTPYIYGVVGGIWTVTVIDALTGCSITPNIDIYRPPQLISYILVPSPTLCAGESVTLTGITGGGVPGAYTYSWSHSSVTSNTCVVSEAPGGVFNYSLTSWDVTNCSVTTMETVTFVPNPVLVMPDVYICPGQTATLSITGATTYTWSNNTFTNFIVDTPTTSTQYTVIGTAQSCTSAGSAYIIHKPVPVPQFSVNSPVCNGEILQLDVSAAATYVWNGPLGFVSYVKNPVINPAGPNDSGVYNVTVTAANSCTGSTSGTILVNPTPTVAATGATICINQPLVLSSSSFTGATFAWTGPLGFNSTLQNPTITSPAVQGSGAYTLVAKSVDGCTNSAVVNVTVTGMPQPVLTSNSPKCFGQNLNFAANGALSYQWNGPNNFSSIQQFPSIPFASTAATGVYSVTATIGPCTTIATLNAIVHPLPSPTITGNMPVCEDKLLLLGVNNNSIISIQWTGPEGFFATSANVSRDSCQLPHAGVYSVTVTDVHNCVNSTAVTVAILVNPIVIASGSLVCFSDAATLHAYGADTYQWQGPSNYFSPVQHAYIQSAKNVSAETYSVMGTAVNGCTAVSSAVLETIPLPHPALVADPSLRACLYDQITIKGFGGAAYVWLGPGEFRFEGQTLGLNLSSFAMGGTYTLVVADTSACKSYSTAMVSVDPLPTAKVQFEKEEACAPFCSDVALISEPQNQARWLIANTTYTGNIFRHCFNQPGTYTVELSLSDNNTSCRSAMRYYVKARPQPVADFNFVPENPVENTDEVHFVSSSGGEALSKWTWFFNSGLEGEAEKKTEQAWFLYKNAGTYPIALVVENKYGCRDTVVKIIRVEEDFNLFVPNAFTPNGDGINEIFVPVGRGIRQYQLTLFDRWGHVLFESNELKNGWDGNYKNDPSPIGEYNWKITVTSDRGESKMLNGSVLLKR